MKTFKKAMLGATVGAIVAIAGTGAASADPVYFTWNPAAAGLVGSSFTSDDLTIADYATIDAHNPTDVLETANLVVQNLNLDAAHNTFANGLGFQGNSLGGPAVPGNYQLYFALTSTSNLTNDTLQSVSYTLYGIAGGGCSFGVSNGNLTISGLNTNCSSTANQVALATGSLYSGSVGFASDSTPVADASVTINPTAAGSGFFVSPSAVQLALGDLFDTKFINLPSQSLFCSAGYTNCQNPPAGSIATGQYIEITGGGGTVDMAVPEPLTLSLFGAGLVGAGVLRRRQKSKKA